MIDLVVERQQSAISQFFSEVVIVGSRGQGLVGQYFSLHFRDVVLGQAKNHRDGLQLSDNDQGGIGADLVAGVYHP